MSIKAAFDRILNEYAEASTEEFAKHPLANFIRHDLPETISAASNDAERFVFKGSAGCRNASKSDPGCALNIDPPLIVHSTT